MAAAVAAGALAFVAVPASGAPKTYDFTFTSGYPLTFVWAQQLNEVFMPTIDAELAKTGAYKINWNKAFGGALGKPNEQLELVQKGLAQVGDVVLPFLASQLPLHNVGFAVPFGTGDVAVATAALHEMHTTIPAFKATWDKYNQVYLGGLALDSYHIATTFPLKTVEDLKGKKIGAAGLNQAWIANTGAAGVGIAAVTVYNDLKTGVVQGAILTGTLFHSAKVYEVAPYVTKAYLGAVYQITVTVNKDVWVELPAEVQAAFTLAGQRYMASGIEALKTREVTAFKEMAEKGATIYELPQEERVRWANILPNQPKTWAGTDPERMAVLTAYMDKLRAAGTPLPRQWDKE